MPQPSKQLVRAILIGLMLIVGSVQADASYLCGMMDMVNHDDCCCADAAMDEMMAADSDQPCCEKSVALGIDVTTDQSQPQVKPIKFESDVDPPDNIAFAVENSPQIINRAAIISIKRTATSHSAGSATYLLTQRLRI